MLRLAIAALAAWEDDVMVMANLLNTETPGTLILSLLDNVSLVVEKNVYPDI
jgi:hypothetical protein